MRVNYFEVSGEKHVYNYFCSECKKTYSTWPVYYPGKRQCKYCPECGHKFEEPEGAE